MNGYGKVQYSGVTDADIRGRQMEELIRKKDALDALMAERKHLLANGQKGAEHILTHHGYNVIDELQPVQSDVPVINVGDMISRQAAVDALDEQIEQCNKALSSFDISLKDEFAIKVERASLKAYREQLENLPPVQPKIIHCKDCKHWNLQVGNVKGDGLGSCDFHNVNLVTGEGFCYWADRKGDLDAAD